MYQKNRGFIMIRFGCAARSFIFALLFAGSGSSALAYDLPVVNLGATSFVDGLPPAGAGWYFTEYLQRYDSDRFNDKDGHPLPLPKTEAAFDISLTQLAYIGDVDVLGGKLGFVAMVPSVINEDVDDGINNMALNASSGVGDLLIAPAILWAPVMGAEGPVFAHRLELQFILPTGKYDKSNTINPGSNHWSFNPYWAGTYWVSPKWTASWRLHYLLNGTNNDPSVSYGPGVNSVKPGQALHANFATSYELNRAFRIGLNGYWLRQISDTEINGDSVSGRKEKVWAVGPGAVLSFSKDDHIFANAYFERGAENRSEGNRFQLRWVHHF
uniref:Phenol degradation protein meta n=1 Tax=Neptuniibacter sp. CAR-SF TaxID=197651 RepID=B2DD10_9GAMM|nr:hypothetical protein [Neptuniibacter sp. CAR-SF]